VVEPGRRAAGELVARCRPARPAQAGIEPRSSGPGRPKAWIVTDEPVPNSTFRLFDPVRVVLADDEGGYALRDLAPGRRWVEITGPYQEMGIGFFTFRAGAVDTVIVRVEPNGKTPPKLAGFDRREQWSPASGLVPDWGERLAVRVREKTGVAVPHAYVVVIQGKTIFGGLADSLGQLMFPAVPSGPGELVVRSANHEPFSRLIQFQDAARESLDVRLNLLKEAQGSR
jgi:hypothetical protein